MNKLTLKLEYQKFLVCADQKDEQALIGILGRGFIVKKDWQLGDAIYVIDEQPEINFIDGDEILMEKPEPEVKQEVTENVE